MNARQGDIHIVHIFNDEYWAPAFAVMRSICLATKRRRDLVFHLVCLGLSADHRADLEKIGEEFGARQRIVALEKRPEYSALAGRLPRKSKHLAALLYARLLLDELLPPEVARFIYTDSDMMFRADIGELWTLDLQDFAIAAVQDAFYHMVLGRRLKRLGGLFDLAVPYFNSGLMVVDRQRWRTADPMTTMNRLLGEEVMKHIYYDQDVLNLAFRDKWLRLNHTWNFLNPRPEHESLNPRVAHFTGPHKPWRLRSRAAYSRIYRHVMTNDLYYRYLRFRWRNYWLRGPVQRP